MNKFADLHIHTNISDGSYTPEQAVKKAKERGFYCIAITDHDTVNGVERAYKKGMEIGIEVIPGLELTTMVKTGHQHILGYGIDIENKKLLKTLHYLQDERENRMIKIIKKLNKIGIKVTYDELLKQANPLSIGRPHLANLLLKKGYIKKVEDAFKNYIGEHCPCYVKKKSLDYKQAIELVYSAGGVPVLAHPKQLKDDGKIMKLVGAGIIGLEAYYSEHTIEETERYKTYAQNLDLLITGGSDCHGDFKAELLMGTVRLPYSYVEKLKEAIIDLRVKKRYKKGGIISKIKKFLPI